MRPLSALAILAAFLAFPAHADHDFMYEVEVTNVTKGQTFTPILVATHTHHVRLFEPGQPAGEALEILAEAGDTEPLTNLLLSLGSQVGDVQTIPGLLGPGETTSIQVRASRHARRISVAAMLIPTNDTFFALHSERLPFTGRGAHFKAPAYDAGTEENDQSCANIPGPVCGGAAHSPGPNDGDEGHVHIGNGFHDLGDRDGAGNEVLGPFLYDWRNPVAHVKVRRVR
jgi:hypothetical protein